MQVVRHFSFPGLHVLDSSPWSQFLPRELRAEEAKTRHEEEGVEAEQDVLVSEPHFKAMSVKYHI